MYQFIRVSLFHPFDFFLLIIYNLYHTVQGIEDAVVNKTEIVPALIGPML